MFYSAFLMLRQMFYLTICFKSCSCLHFYRWFYFFLKAFIFIVLDWINRRDDLSAGVLMNSIQHLRPIPATDTFLPLIG